MDPCRGCLHLAGLGGATLRSRSWIETKDIRPINTGSEMMEVRKGDLVVCFVVERWTDDFEAAIEALRKLHCGDKP